MRNVEKAVEEAIAKADDELRVKKKSLSTIQVDTAYKWFGRAVVAKRLGRTEDVHEFAHEALEHAALAKDHDLIGVIRTLLKRERITA
jgi:hypothetical protein